MAQRTTLSYTVLGLLAMRDMSAYELVQGYRRSMGQIARRSDAAIYNEPKKLVADGLVSATDEPRGRRAVAVYSATDLGREELDRWLGEPASFPQLDAEPIVKLVFADRDQLADLRSTIVEFKEEVVVRMLELRRVGDEYLSDGGPYQPRSDLVALSGRFVADLFATYMLWCDSALEALDEWETSSQDERAEWARSSFEATVRTMDRLGPSNS
jgi:PadR family transcriptional regulator AphA